METCLFCLEPAEEDNPVLCINFSKYPDVCSCRITSHMDCWMIYYLKKSYFECPICHTKRDQSSQPEIEQNITVRTENVIVQIRAPTPQIQVRERPSEEALRKNVLCLCCGCFSCMTTFIIFLLVPVYVLIR